MPELVLSTHSQSWRREEAAEPVGALSRLKLRKKQVRAEWEAKITERITVTVFMCLKIHSLSWSS